MFTGIIEEVGTIQAITRGQQSIQLTIGAKLILEDIHLGDSIAVNGICLTVISFDAHTFIVDVMPETMKATSIHLLKNGDTVNMERAMAANGRFGGHFVTGHVDGTGTILRKRKKDNAVYLDIQIDQALSEACLPRGSITIDGISLTIFDIKRNQVTVSLVPHTYSKTILGKKNEGSVVNIECDLLGKYIFQYLNKRENPTITMEFLRENGF